MPRYLTTMAMLAGSAGMLLAAPAARAETVGAASDVAAARIAWADRRVAMVCGPLREAGERGRAESCEADAWRVRQDARRGLDATASLAAATPFVMADAAPPRSGTLILRSFTSLGVGF